MKECFYQTNSNRNYKRMIISPFLTKEYLKTKLTSKEKILTSQVRSKSCNILKKFKQRKWTIPNRQLFQLKILKSPIKNQIKEWTPNKELLFKTYPTLKMKWIIKEWDLSSKWLFQLASLNWTIKYPIKEWTLNNKLFIRYWIIKKYKIM